MLFIMLANEEHDSRIRPQGMKVGSFTVPATQHDTSQPADEPEVRDEEDAVQLVGSREKLMKEKVKVKSWNLNVKM